MNNSTISGNVVRANTVVGGGGVWNGGDTRLTNTTISGNTSSKNTTGSGVTSVLAALTFTRANWNVPQTVNFTIPGDSLVNPVPLQAVVRYTVSSNITTLDSRYGGPNINIPTQIVTITATDDDGAPPGARAANGAAGPARHGRSHRPGQRRNSAGTRFLASACQP